MIIFIQANSTGFLSGPFNIYSDATVPPYSAAFETGISQATLDAGFFSYSAPPGTTTIRVKSMGPDCTNEVYVPISPSTLVVTNDLANIGDVIYGISPTFYDITFPDNSFPVSSGQTSYFGFDTFTGSMSVELECVTVPSKLTLFIDGTQVDCQDITVPGLQTITFTGLTIASTSYVELILSSGSC